jgi:putative membrane protein insertion efficiency factor
MRENLTPNPFPLWEGEPEGMARAARLVPVGIVAIYRAAISPVIHAINGPACRFEPSCSVYARDAIAEYGIIRGGIMAIWRIARCNPIGGHGFDPVRSSSLAPRGREGLSGVRDDCAARMSDAPHIQKFGKFGPSPAAQNLASTSPLVGRGNSKQGARVCK